MRFFTGFGKGVKQFGQIITTLVNCVLLLAAYILGVGISALTARVLRKKFMDTTPSEKCKTYWTDIQLKKKPLKEYYRQF